MARDTQAKCKYCRREGTKLFLKGERCYSTKCAIVKRNFPPGMHGPTARPRLSDYGKQLREKQKVKRTYGIMEAQLQLYFQKSMKQRGDTGETLMRLLEMRLDNLVYRLGFVSSRALARQLVTHGHFLVNDKNVNIPSYQVKPNDVIMLKKGSREVPLFANLEKTFNEKETAQWLLVDPVHFSGKALQYPDKDALAQPFDIKVVVEYYSR